MEKQLDLIRSNTLSGSTTSAEEYSEFLETFVKEVNERLTKLERNLYELGEFILNRCEEGRKFGKTKEEVFSDLCSHPEFRYNKFTLYQYSRTAEFIRRLPEKIVVDNNNIPFTVIREIALAKLPQKEKEELVLQLQKTPKPRQQEVRQIVQAKRAEIYRPLEDKSWLIPYDIWQFPTCDPRFGEAGFPGRIPGQVILNLIHYYMEGDTFLSVYPGSHTDRDVCHYLGKRCIELNQDVRQSWDIEDSSIDFVFHDPPYWHAKEKEYKREDDLSHLPLDDFYEAIDWTARESLRVLKMGGRVAIIIGNERNPFEDLGFNTYQIFKKYFTPIDRVVVPYAGNSAMHTAWALSKARENKFMLNGFRDLMIFQKVI